jgi:hypothetical protein
MARKPRLDFPGAFFHVVVRDNQRVTIFHDEADYSAYLSRLERYRRRDGGTLHAYILMRITCISCWRPGHSRCPTRISTPPACVHR